MLVEFTRYALIMVHSLRSHLKCKVNLIIYQYIHKVKHESPPLQMVHLFEHAPKWRFNNFIYALTVNLL